MSRPTEVAVLLPLDLGVAAGVMQGIATVWPDAVLQEPTGADPTDRMVFLVDADARVDPDDLDNDIWEAVRRERARAHAKHGDTSMESSPAHDPVGRRMRILLEEFGEVAQEFNDAEHEQRPVDIAKLRKELIQVAAMAGAWADACGDDA